MANELLCLNCGKGFIPTCHITRQKFSSSECRVRYCTDTPVNECPGCGTPIQQSGEAGRWHQCEKEEACVPMKKSTVPPALLPGSGIVSASLLAQIMNSKYVLALPLYRQEQELCRLGLPVSRQTMSNWVLTAGERWLLPVYHALHKELLANKILHADETTLMVLREPERQARQRSYVWLYRTSGDALRPVVLYDYQPSRAGVCASRFLKGFSGYLHTDGYEAYHCSLRETVCSVGCWAHMRRKFTDTLRSLPKELRSRAPAQVGLDLCNRLFALEAEF